MQDSKYLEQLRQELVELSPDFAHDEKNIKNLISHMLSHKITLKINLLIDYQDILHGVKNLITLTLKFKQEPLDWVVLLRMDYLDWYCALLFFILFLESKISMNYYYLLSLRSLLDLEVILHDT